MIMDGNERKEFSQILLVDNLFVEGFIYDMLNVRHFSYMKRRHRSKCCYNLCQCTGYSLSHDE